VNSAEIKIVGAVTDENALEEIEDIAKVFAYEQHMKDYTRVFQTPYHTKKVPIINEKVIGEPTRLIQSTSPRIPVKGLC
jgi:hypothetical protein